MAGVCLHCHGARTTRSRRARDPLATKPCSTTFDLDQMRTTPSIIHLDPSAWGAPTAGTLPLCKSGKTFHPRSLPIRSGRVKDNSLRVFPLPVKRTAGRGRADNKEPSKERRRCAATAQE
jgi:hypothetical protein